ncbi:MAG: ANTAR domain-containing protein [Nitriliruptorales bacterium]|nr:ANTAR domain-containing protein [Nitriliruptorales bacterium]
MLQLSVDLAAEIIAGVDLADIMLVQDGEVTVPVSTDPIAVEIDQAQQQAGSGPCIDVLFDEDLDRVVIQDLQDEDRWPEFRKVASEHGVRSVAAYRVIRNVDGTKTLGAMNLFGFEPTRNELAVDLGQVFATHVSTVLEAEIDREGLQTALATRDVIGQAKGILMERHRLTADQAFGLLRRASNNRNVKVRDLAQRVTETGELPD